MKSVLILIEKNISYFVFRGQDIIMIEIFSINSIDDIVFESYEIPQFQEETSTISYRITENQLSKLPLVTKDTNALRRKISEIFNTVFHRNYAKLETECDIKSNTFQKVMRFNNCRNVTYIFLAKFCIGAKLSITVTNELFALMGHELNKKNRSDYILLCELQNHCDILEYDEDMKKYCNTSILSET